MFALWGDGVMRSLLLGYLVVATVVGPRFCPCVVAGEECSARGMLLSEAAPLPCGCVPHDLPHPTEQNLDEPSPGDSSSRDSSAPCRCQCGPGTLVAARPTTRSVPGEDLPDFPAPSVVCGQVPESASHSRIRLAPGSPFVTTEDLLYSFHILRC